RRGRRPGRPLCLLHEQGSGVDHDLLGRPRLSRPQHPLQLHFSCARAHTLRGRLRAQELSRARGRNVPQAGAVATHRAHGPTGRGRVIGAVSLFRCRRFHNRKQLPHRRRLPESARLSAAAASLRSTMRIDSHQHFWQYDPGRDGWITDEMAVLKRDFLPNDLIPLMRANGIDASIAVQADQSEAETRFLLELADHHAEIAGIVGWVNLCSENVRARLQHFSQFRKLRGFRHIVQAEPDERFLLRKDFLRGVEALAEFGFTYDILIYARHLPVVNEFVRQFPRQKFVVDHLGKPAIKAQEIELWKSELRALAENPNVFCKLSGMVVEADWRSWKPADFDPYLDVV